MHQGSSLYGRAQQDALRLISVASIPGGRSLEMLWAICMHLQGLGYPTVVLDGSTSETNESPGLVDLIEHNFRIDAPMGVSTQSEQSLAVLPAARGLAALDPRGERIGAAPLHRLEPLLRRYAVVVLYAPMPVLAASLMAGSAASPLLLLEDGEGGVMRAYKDIKWLALETGLAATVVSLARGQTQRAGAHRQLRALRACAAKHLGQPPRTLAMDPDRPADLQRLALELLENAQAIVPEEAYAALPSSRGASRAPHFATSH
ncbi:MAG: hypothetical protein ACTS5V_04640 [Giesbergeria sp.]